MSELLYDVSIHTEGARLDQLDRIASYCPDALIIGSVGRAAITGQEVSIQKGNLARDIDVTTTTGDIAHLDASLKHPYPVDHALAMQIMLAEGGDFASVRYDPRRPDVAVELPAEVFEPYQVQFGGVTFNTLHPDTLRHIHLISDNRRHKDGKSLADFEQALEGVEYTHLPESYFSPLRDLHHMVLRDPELRRQYVTDRLRYVYDQYVPVGIQAVTRARLASFRQRLGIKDRKSIVDTAERLNNDN